MSERPADRRFRSASPTGSERAGRAGDPERPDNRLVIAQRFGEALNLNLHFHALVLDGVDTSQGLLATPRFQPASELRDEDVAHGSAILHRRIVRHLQRGGRLPREKHAEHAEHDGPEPDEPPLALLSAASVQGRTALGPDSGKPLVRRGRQRDCRPLFLPGELCCDLEGVSLRAKVAIEGHDRAGLERLCQYIARPAIASERL